VKKGNASRLLHIMRLSITLGRHQLAGNKRQFTRALFDSMFNLGGVYVKFLQALLIRSDLFEEQYVTHQIKIYEDVDTEPLDLDATLSHELGPNWSQHFSQVERQPFAAGSFGQVYRAALNDGSDVIIKVLRPRLAQTLGFDMRLIGVTTRLIGLIRPDAMINVRDVFRDFRDATLSETDYRSEAAFASDLYERYLNHPVITIPKTHLHISTARIIVQGYVDGISISQLLNVAPDDPISYMQDNYGCDLVYQLKEMGYEMLYSAFKYPVIQGDPHPGNIKLMSGNRVGLIDFGLISRPPRDRESLLILVKEYANVYNGRLDVQGFSLALMRMFSSNLVYSIESLGNLLRNPARSQDLFDELADSAQSTYQAKGVEFERLLERGHFLTAFSNVINEGNRFGLRLHIEATTFTRSSQMFITMVDTLGCKPVVMHEVYNRVIADVERNRWELIPSSRPTVSYEQAIETVGNWMDRIASTDPYLFNKVTGHLKRRYYV
jgi:serine/threonine protein kinase